MLFRTPTLSDSCEYLCSGLYHNYLRGSWIELTVSMHSWNQVRRAKEFRHPTAKLQSEVISGNLANCTARFKGGKGNDVKALIDALEIYKDCMHVSNANALEGLPMLLEENSFRQNKTPTDIFVCKACTIISQLPQDTLPEAVHLGMIYGLLSKRIREEISRDSLKGFSDLLTQAGLIEKTSPERDSPWSEIVKRLKCFYCKNFGHTKDQCRKLQKINTGPA
ncbi:hypothetical protein ILUMI_06166 [Ignelater luminosus]|uniref:CCHC-type domain-containing protein n=1 Tax=Ignelater luminosus TaxID=2038154 RepID=A0A8K0DB80_IGNLU|nr:hypothetical protein ILUMI_06166 [Ignelater luminosus]